MCGNLGICAIIVRLVLLLIYITYLIVGNDSTTMYILDVIKIFSMDMSSIRFLEMKTYVFLVSIIIFEAKYGH